ncbi:MAG: hypothetical protein HYZ43_03675, partial [Flavobacteriia bacterium]|nr:hypothetical protein [Flavobacteriia bacterium]
AERKIVEDIADYHLIKGKNTALSTRASSICYYVKGLCAATNRNYEDSFQFFNRTRDILDNNPKSRKISDTAMWLHYRIYCVATSIISSLKKQNV